MTTIRFGAAILRLEQKPQRQNQQEKVRTRITLTVKPHDNDPALYWHQNGKEIPIGVLGAHRALKAPSAGDKAGQRQYAQMWIRGIVGNRNDGLAQTFVSQFKAPLLKAMTSPEADITPLKTPDEPLGSFVIAMTAAMPRLTSASENASGATV